MWAHHSKQKHWTLTTGCWTIINKNMLEATKKDTLHSKTKKKPQQYSRRSTILIKSNPIPAGWVTHKLENNYTREVLTWEWKPWAHVRVTRLASDNGRRRPGGIWLWRPVGFDHRNSIGLEEKETPFMEGAYKVSCTSGPRKKSSDPRRDWARPTC